ncbi:lysophospholipase L1-like esterase [Rhodopirellula rubra]|uniref:Lysophospholipase L1-like esterase n=1 Tax=Aporhodopirellula rubra TaxID=980271 RepID=A0A7W5DWD9_9BACT|nr:rhamnogalacturonan acetylesterase [Aporhodopirellula rubra]MBB3205743.1 lysophospholipase L1-like esterase [Aporhodopirellula rubra]
MLNQILVTRTWHGLLLCFSMSALCFPVAGAEHKFDFGSGISQPGVVNVTPQTMYDSTRGFGFLKTEAARTGTSSLFAVDVPEGNYDVTLRFGDSVDATSTTVKSEARRLMLERIETAPGEYQTHTFTVNVRKPPISTGGRTRINSREMGPPVIAGWDEHLTLEFSGPRPGVVSLEIKPETHAITVFIAGDSTVTDQRNEPWSGWGQMIPRFFEQGVAVSNQAESGLALFSFESQKRLAKVLSMMKEGDYLFIQFGHNDQKDKRPDAGPFTTYQANLKKFIEATRDHGGIPVLVTPMERRRWSGGKQQQTLTDYAQAVRQTGAALNVPVIDLHAMSLAFYAALGVENSKRAFVHYPAKTYPGQDSVLKDDTHHNVYGAYELARCVVEGIKSNVPELANFLAEDVGNFDPALPDAHESINIPVTPILGDAETPAGN